MQTTQELIAQLGSNDAQGFRARHELEKLSAQVGAPGQESARADLAAVLATELTAVDIDKSQSGRPSAKRKHLPAARSEIAQILSLVAGEQQVATLNGAMEDLETREMGRWALDRNPSDQATTALIQAATDAVGSEFRVGAINALGKRRGTDVTGALRQLVSDPNLAVRLAAVDALANQPDPGADEVMVAAMTQGLDAADQLIARRSIAKARIRLAETLAKSGYGADARAILQKVQQQSEIAEPQKQAAKRALENLS